jgi:hypothetical protein
MDGREEEKEVADIGNECATEYGDCEDTETETDDKNGVQSQSGEAK